jgi:hypothetical protein
VRSLLLPVFLLAAPLVAVSPPAEPPTRISTLVVYGRDPCPRSTGDEVVVCARQPESERYRIPKQFRGQDPKRPAAVTGSWAGTARVLEMVSKEGLPNSCSTTGANGQTGCFAKFIADNRRGP